ncbi:MAG: glycosyltransferase family 2 protein [Planctomycetota bacterium]|jgi:glycosyltransferase involved in cell wall biosynthesis
MMEISVIICNDEENQDLLPCVDAAINQEYNNAFEIILIDDCSKNKSLNSLQHMPLTLIEKDKQTGWFASLNLAVDTAQFDILAFTDSHCIVDKDWLKKIYEIFDNKKLISGYVYHGTRFVEKFSHLFTHLEFSWLERKYITNIFDGNFIVSKDFLKTTLSHLPVNENVTGGTGAPVLANAVIKNGNPIYHEPEIKVFHLSESFWESMKQWFYGFGPNTIIIRRLNPDSIGAKYLTLGLLAPFVFAVGRWVSLSKKFVTYRKNFDIRTYELPLYFLWYNACISSYLLGMLKYMINERKY